MPRRVAGAAVSQCSVCGAEIVERDGLAYVPDTIGTLHGCTAPDPEMPDVEGVAMVWDDATGTLVEA